MPWIRISKKYFKIIKYYETLILLNILAMNNAELFASAELLGNKNTKKKFFFDKKI